MDSGRDVQKAEHLPVIQLIAEVMRAVQSIAKKERNTQQGFNFRGIDSVVNAVGPAFRDFGVFVVPELLDTVEERYLTDKQKTMKGVTVKVRFTVHGPAGDTVTGVVSGEASDAGDKATPKAYSVAFRTFLLQLLCIPTDEPDPDLHVVERGPQPLPVQAPTAMDEELRNNLVMDIEAAQNERELRAVWDTIMALYQQGQITDPAYKAFSNRIKARRADLAAEGPQ